MSEENNRPKTRGECLETERPCPYVGCKHHLYLEVNPDTGKIKYNFPNLDVCDMVESCVLDIADRGEMILEDVGTAIGKTKQRVRQIEQEALLKLKENEALENV